MNGGEAQSFHLELAPEKAHSSKAFLTERPHRFCQALWQRILTVERSQLVASVDRDIGILRFATSKHFSTTGKNGS